MILAQLQISEPRDMAPRKTRFEEYYIVNYLPIRELLFVSVNQPPGNPYIKRRPSSMVSYATLSNTEKLF